jgi:uncharacterized membrane protein YgaE (UPF0421/DUF939 family)
MLIDGLRARLGIDTGRIPGVRTAKTTLAAVLSYEVALAVTGDRKPVLAALTALLVVQLTLYETVTSGLRRVLSVVAGVLVALGFSDVTGITWWSLGLLIMASLVLGQLLRVGSQLMEVPISAMLVLAVGTAGEQLAFGRVYETLIGAGVGVGVNAVIAPPLYVQPAGDAIRELALRMAAVLRRAAKDLRAGWSHEDAKSWLDQARRLGADVDRAERALARAEQSLRLNPRARMVTPTARPSLRGALAALEHASVSVRGICRALADRAELSPGESPYADRDRRALSELLDDVAMAVECFGRLATEDVAGPTADDAALRRALTSAHRRRDSMGGVLVLDAAAEPGIWPLHGSLLADIDRVLREVDPEAGSAAHAVPRGQRPRGAGRADARRLRIRRSMQPALRLGRRLRARSGYSGRSR